MKRFAAIVFFFSLMSLSHAQTLPSPEVQAIGQKLMAEINSNIQCSSLGISLQQQLSAAQAQIKALKDKYENTEEKK